MSKKFVIEHGVVREIETACGDCVAFNEHQSAVAKNGLWVCRTGECFDSRSEHFGHVLAADHPGCAQWRRVTPGPDRERRYPVLCAWCAAEGKRRVVGWTAVEGSHGICVDHRLELLKDAKIR